ncbi:threonine aldolase family protein [Listeria fleischmannii]|uniref:threonine aldolase family protein n=1 Tax=Listeria fleischmannii TaxID=1069827 RepID=UPI001625E0F7|nr:beta-eliminating lyase-related protein [Listeria fleischmannii]MBC1418696.1 low specificity L-threonine aldolase [Listeria fleischmannii]
MENADQLKQTYQATTYKLSNNGPRNIAVLQEAISGICGDELSDIYGTGEIITHFEEKIARVLGLEGAVFFPSGTMAQQIALRIWADRKQIPKVAYHPLAHLEIHEADGLKQIHHIETLLLGESDRVVTLADIKSLSQKVSCVLLELPQREIGGQLPSFQELVEISTYCREHQIALHLDGARLFEILPFYQKEAKEVCALFDSVYVSFYKGLGGIAGAILAGPNDFLEEAKIWKRRYGGDLISLYPYILSADYYYEKRKDSMALYYEKAVELAKQFNQLPGVRTIPEIPVSNMFHVEFLKPVLEVKARLAQIHQETDIGLTGYLVEKDTNTSSFELTVGDAIFKIPPKELLHLFQVLS